MLQAEAKERHTLRFLGSVGPSMQHALMYKHSEVFKSGTAASHAYL